MFPRHRPIYSNNNTLAVFPLPSFNQHRVVDILHTLHITVYMKRPYFPQGRMTKIMT